MTRTSYLPALLLAFSGPLPGCHGSGVSGTAEPGTVPGDTGAQAPDTGGTSDTDPYTGPLCEPEASVEDPPYYLEGETVALSYTCGSGEDPADFEARLASAPDGATFDEEDWSVTWTTDLDDGGRWDLLLSVSPRDYDGGDLPETATGTVWVADAKDDPQNVPVDPEAYTEEWGLPVIHVEPHESLSQSYVPATITAFGTSYEAQIKIRGAASSSYPKNSFTMRFGNEDLDADAVGMGNKDHLIAITSFDDNSYVRQKLIYDLWIAMAEYWDRDRLTPRTFFGVLYLYGEYFGLYTFCDRIDDHFAQEMGLERSGNLYKAVNHDANFYRTDSSGNAKDTLHDGYEKKEGTPEEGEVGAFDDLDSLVAFSADSDENTFKAQADAWIRVDEFMDWLLLVHYTASDDSGGKNSYLYNDTENFEFRYAPWDFNHSFGQGWYVYRIDPDTYNLFTGNNGIFNHFLTEPATEQEVWDRFWAMMEDGPLHPDWFQQQLDDYYALIDRSARRDWDMWAASYHDYWGSYNENSYDEEVTYLYEWLEQRNHWMEVYNGEYRQ